MPARGSLFVISAPSGAGKTTLCRRALQRIPLLEFSVSYTTRAKRPGEQEGVDYFFVSKEEFEERIRQGAMAEWARVHSHLYGTARETIDRVLSRGRDLLVDVDVQGYRQLKKSYPDAVGVFVLPPSLRVLKERLTRRGQDSPDAIIRRLQAARAEIEAAPEYDYAVVNDDLERAADRFIAVIEAERCRVRRLLPRISALIRE